MPVTVCKINNSFTQNIKDAKEETTDISNQ